MNIRNHKKVKPVHSLHPAEPERIVDWTFVALATGLTLFFAILLVLMLIGFKGVESGVEYNEVVLCILRIL